MVTLCLSMILEYSSGILLKFRIYLTQRAKIVYRIQSHGKNCIFFEREMLWTRTFSM